MFGKWFLLLLLTVFYCCVPFVSAAVELSALERDQPIEVTAQQLEVLQLQRQSIFTGEVVARQGDMTLYAEKLLVIFQQEHDEVERLEAIGGVRVVQLDRIATAEKAIFYQLEGRLVLNGNAEVTQGENKIAGDRITLYLKENRSLVESSESGRVRAIIVPEKKPAKQ